MRKFYTSESVSEGHPDKLADFVILAADPLEAPEGDISSIEVVETWVNGVRVYAG